MTNTFEPIKVIWRKNVLDSDTVRNKQTFVAEQLGPTILTLFLPHINQKNCTRHKPNQCCPIERRVVDNGKPR